MRDLIRNLDKCMKLIEESKEIMEREVKKSEENLKKLKTKGVKNEKSKT